MSVVEDDEQVYRAAWTEYYAADLLSRPSDVLQLLLEDAEEATFNMASSHANLSVSDMMRIRRECRSAALDYVVGLR